MAREPAKRLGPYDRALADHLKRAKRLWPEIASWQRGGIVDAITRDAFASGWRAAKLFQSRKRGNRR